MEINASALKTLFNKLYKFVMGQPDELIDLGDGRKLPTLSGIEKKSQALGCLQVARDYSKLEIATADAIAQRIQPGQIVRVWDDIPKLNGYHQLSNSLNFEKMDLYDLAQFQIKERDIMLSRESIGLTHEIASMMIDAPLALQRRGWMAKIAIYVESDIHTGYYEIVCLFGFNTIGKYCRWTQSSPAISLQEKTLDDLSPQIEFYQEGDDYRFSATLNSTEEVKYSTHVAISPSVAHF